MLGIGDPIGWVIVMGIFSSTLGWLGCKFLVGRQLTDMQKRVDSLEGSLNVANHDPLTGLPNRQMADEAMAEIRRKHTRMSLGIVDINGLKRINDEFGHQAGDELIKAIVNRMLQLLPKTSGGLIARLGGSSDEFLIIAAVSAEELEVAYRDAFVGSNGTASIGIAECGPDDDVSHVKRCADKAMYAAKTIGAGKVMIWTPVLGEPDDMNQYHDGDRRQGSRSPLIIRKGLML